MITTINTNANVGISRNINVNAEISDNNATNIAVIESSNTRVARHNRRIISTSNNCHRSNIKSKIRCLNTNAQSLQYKIDELKKLISDYEVQIITVTETWGQPWKEAALDIEGYNMYRQDRSDGRKGGGQHNLHKPGAKIIWMQAT